MTKEEIYNCILENHKKSNGSCGLPTTRLVSENNTTLKTIRPILVELYNENKILVRQGINGKLLFIK
jgi:hypothetical protein